ncbi:MAG: prepilin-type N-terminal cleavage/methylation domain-containing protein [Hyphomicrobium sp.]|jgi:prepilin-type N-terminal cleavage/methylation domain-containing protein
MIREHGDATGHDAGFSLLEVLVSLVLIALIVCMMPGTVRLAHRALQIADGLERISSDAAALDLVERRLSEAMPIYEHSADGLLAVAFKGDAHSLTFVAPMVTETAESGLYLFAFGALPTADNNEAIALSWQPFRAKPDPRERPPSVEQRILVRRIRDFSLRYLGAGSPDKDADWLDTWKQSDGLPTLIEINYSPDHAGAPSRSRRVELHLRAKQ